MLERLGTITEAATGILEAKAQLAIRDLERVGARTGAYIAGGTVMALGACIVLAGIAVLLADLVGAGPALLIVGVLALVGGFVMVRSFSPTRDTGKSRPSREELELQVQQNLEALRAATAPPPAPCDEPAKGGMPSAEEFIGAVKQNPQVLASAAFAALSILGPARSLKILGTTATAAGVAASIGKAVKNLRDSHFPGFTRPGPTDHAGSNGAPFTPTPGAPTSHPSPARGPV